VRVLILWRLQGYAQVTPWLQEVLAQYSSVFAALLSLRIMAWRLQRQWQLAVQQQGEAPRRCQPTCMLLIPAW
jgi:hypothetical protein